MPSATSKGPQVKTTEPMISTKVTDCSSIQSGRIPGPNGLHGVSSRALKVRFFHLVRGHGCSDASNRLPFFR